MGKLSTYNHSTYNMVTGGAPPPLQEPSSNFLLAPFTNDDNSSEWVVSTMTRSEAGVGVGGAGAQTTPTSPGTCPCPPEQVYSSSSLCSYLAGTPRYPWSSFLLLLLLILLVQCSLATTTSTPPPQDSTDDKRRSLNPRFQVRPLPPHSPAPRGVL